MSPRAACRLEHFGFTKVYDYTAGIADWKAAGLALEGDGKPDLTVADAMRTDVPTATLEEGLGDVRVRTLDAGWDECIVVDCDNVVVGRLRGKAWDADETIAVEAVMEPGPTTVRPDTLLEPLVKRMEKRGTRLVVVASPQGQLLGAMLHDEADRLAEGEEPSRIWQDCDGCPGQWRPPRRAQSGAGQAQ